MYKVYNGETVKESKELRKVVCEKMDEFMSKDEKVVLLDADLMGSLGSLSLKDKFNDRVINVGIMEAQEISSAAGFRLTGLKPFVHTFTAFASRRCLDQIFISSLYQKNPMTVIASDAGIQAVHNGGTHMSFEDMGLIRGLANSVVIEPTDSNVLSSVLEEVYRNDDKFYWIRLTRKNVFKVYEEGSKFEIGKGNLLKEGKDVTIIAIGMMVKEAQNAASMLEKEGISATVIDMFTLKPIDKDMIIKYCKDTKLVVTAENHSITNGLGSAVAEVLSENCPKKLVRVGVKERFGQVGTLEFLQEEYELRAEDIYKAVKNNL
ncbi:transketolase C-terminal domain-containing protein [Pseudostreptobacillus hongkongensis]|uniref:transketolase family protein n=1 Tax=Pseudostreptobacillus hongkongensis TaxID=1162717 RepID=UPI0028D5D94A|nr:transketolase C-terminal domain-containing protein [Pseudostreptobacillus hongkongensis]